MCGKIADDAHIKSRDHQKWVEHAYLFVPEMRDDIPEARDNIRGMRDNVPSCRSDLPPGWFSEMDPSTGMEYYYHERPSWPPSSQPFDLARDAWQASSPALLAGA